MQPYHFKADNLKFKDSWYYISNSYSSWFDSKWQWFKVNFLLGIAVKINDHRPAYTHKVTL